MRLPMRLAVFAPCLVLYGCGQEPTTGAGATEAVVTKQGSLIINTFQDDSAAPVHVQVKSCTSSTPEHAPSVDCTVDAGYALVGGGAFAEYTGAGALLTTSHGLNDGRTWHAGSKDHMVVDTHRLTTYAIGLRLDGVNAAILRSQLGRSSILQPSVPSAAPSVSLSGSEIGLSGGADTITSGGGQLLTTVRYGLMASKDHLVSSPGQIDGSLISLSGTFGPGTIVEGIGQLQAQYLHGTPATVSTGVGSSTGVVSAGWALAAYGGESTFTSGPGRMLFRVGANGDARSVIVQSKDHMEVSAGATTAWWTEVRKVPGSHGLCTAGGALAASMDPCVASICAADSFCCNVSWDGLCVHEVESICGRGCFDHTCGISSFNPTFWNDDPYVQEKNNCYNYGVNNRTDTRAQPGRSSGDTVILYDIPKVTQAAVNDGLIPTTLAAGCGEGRELLAMVLDLGWDYHWYRRDVNGRWSHKLGNTPARDTDEVGNVITNPETASRGWYATWGGYFCACSSATEGVGHTVIN